MPDDQLSHDLEAALADVTLCAKQHPAIICGGCAEKAKEQTAAILPVVLAAREQATTTERERTLATVRAHYLFGVECDHDAKQDKPLCSCAMLDLGWHPSIGAAVDAWIAHVAALLNNEEPTPDA